MFFLASKEKEKTMLNILFILLGFFIGLSLYFFKNKNRDNLISEQKAKLQAFDEIKFDLQKQINQKDNILEQIRKELDGINEAKTIAETKLEEAIKNIEEQKKLLEDARNKLVETFQAISGESLKSNNKAFLELAKENFGGMLKDIKGVFGQKETAIKNMVDPLAEVLKKYEKQVNELEKSRVQAYGNLDAQVKMLVESQKNLQKETGNLVSALRRPEVRGRWGEITLKRVVELAGMAEHCDYTEQVSVDTDKGKLRPDMVIHMPSNRDIVVDSKVSLDAYLDATAEVDEEKKMSFLTKHASQLRSHMRKLAGKNYWEQFEETPEFVIMFIPGESFLSAALELDPSLIEDGMIEKVVIATPTTLIALLLAIAYGWRQEQITKNAREIANVGKELYDRFQPFLEHLNKTSNNMSQLINSYNNMVGSLEKRVLVSVRKFKELGASSTRELPDVKLVEKIPVKVQESEPV
jgi:DNA recombination protein RmuC